MNVSPGSTPEPSTRSDRQIIEDLAPASPGADAAALTRLRARLADAAESDGLLDVAYRTMDSPVGPLLLA